MHIRILTTRGYSRMLEYFIRIESRKYSVLQLCCYSNIRIVALSLVSSVEYVYRYRLYTHMHSVLYINRLYSDHTVKHILKGGTRLTHNPKTTVIRIVLDAKCCLSAPKTSKSKACIMDIDTDCFISIRKVKI